MPQYDGYVRISTENDTSSARQSTEQLGNTIRDAMDTQPVDHMSGAIDEVHQGIENIGEASLKTGDIIKANLISEIVTQGIQSLGDLLKNAASSTIEFADGMDRAVNKIESSTNASADDMEKLRTVIETIYGDNFGESAEDIADSISKIKQNLGDLSDDELINITESAYALQDVFDYSVDESSRAVKAMMKNFNISAAEAYDYIARGAKNGLDYSGELLDNISEYSVQFNKMGLSASDMFTIFENGAESGAWNLDKIGDSVKELAIRVIDGSNTSKEGFEALGFNADRMAEKFAAGGKTARAAYKEVISALAGMDDPVAQNIAGVNLLGTMWEDMGADAVLALGNISDSAYDCAGTMDSIKNVNYNDLSNSLESVKRQIDLLIQPIGESLIPILNESADAIAEVAEKGDLSGAATSVAEFVSGTLSVLLKNIKLIGSAVTGVTAGVVTFKTASVLTKVIASWQTAALQVNLFVASQGRAALQTAATNGTLTLQEVVLAALSGKLDAATIKTVALNTAMSLNPAGAIAAVIGVLATAITAYVLCTDDAISVSKEFADTLDDIVKRKEDTINQSEAELQVLEKQVNRYEELRLQTSRNSEETAELSRLAEDLQKQFGDNVTVIDTLTGSYNSLSEAYSNYAENVRRSVKTEALRQSAVEAQTALNEMQKEYDILSEKLAAAQERAAKPKSWFSQIVYSEVDEVSLFAGRRDALKREMENAQKIIDDYVYAESDGISADGKSAPRSYIAEEYLRKFAAEKEAAQKAIEENAEMYKQLRADSDYYHKMGVLSDEEYYAQLASLRDNYLAADSTEWRNVNVEIKKYTDSLDTEQKKAYENALKAQEQAAKEAAQARTAAYNEEKSQLQFRLKTGKISEETYYKELAKIRGKYLDRNSKEWRDSFLETYQYNQKIIEENKSALNNLLSDAADSTLSALNNITSARDSLAAKLTDFNKTFEKITETVPETIAVKGEFTITTSEHEVEAYRMDADSIEDNIKVIEKYGEMLDALKARGADSGTLNEILAMDVDEAMEFGTKMLKMSDREWNSYFDSMKRLRQTAADISAKYYQSEAESLKENFVDKLRAELEGLGKDMYTVGADVAAEFVNGWNEALGTKDLTVAEILRSVAPRTIDTAPQAAQQMSAAAVASLESGGQSAAPKQLNMPIYIGTTKLADIMVDTINGKILKDGKNVLLT